MAKKVKKKEEPKELYLSILQASERWPDSKAHTFQLGNQNPNVYYFRLEDPEFINVGDIRSRVKCVKFNKETGYLVTTNVPIKNSDEIKVFTIKDFCDLVIAKMENLQLEPEKNFKLLIAYEALGFLQKSKPLSPTA